MAENENGQDRTELPTQKRLDEARKSGQVPRSRELTTAAVVLVAGIGLRYSGAGMAAGFAALMRSGLTLSREQAREHSMRFTWKESARQFLANIEASRSDLKLAVASSPAAVRAPRPVNNG